MSVCSRRASTRSRIVSPLVPSTTAEKRVSSGSGAAATSIEKSGVLVQPRTAMRCSTPSKLPFELSVPPMPRIVSRLTLLNVYRPDTWVSAGRSVSQGPKEPCAVTVPVGTGLVSSASNPSGWSGPRRRRCTRWRRNVRGVLAGSSGLDHQLRIEDVDGAHLDADRGHRLAPPAVVGVVAVRRDVDLEAAQLHLANARPRVERLEDVRLHAERRDLEERVPRLSAPGLQTNRLGLDAQAARGSGAAATRWSRPRRTAPRAGRPRARARGDRAAGRARRPPRRRRSAARNPSRAAPGPNGRGAAQCSPSSSPSGRRMRRRPARPSLVCVRIISMTHRDAGGRRIAGRPCKAGQVPDGDLDGASHGERSPESRPAQAVSTATGAGLADRRPSHPRPRRHRWTSRTRRSPGLPRARRVRCPAPAESPMRRRCCARPRCSRRRWRACLPGSPSASGAACLVWPSPCRPAALRLSATAARGGCR